MNDKDLLREVVSLAREKEARQRAEPPANDRRTQEIFAPLSEDFRAEITHQLLAETRRQDGSQKVRAIPIPTARELAAKEPGQEKVGVKPVPTTSRRRWISWGLATAAAMVLAVGLWRFVAPPRITETGEAQAYSSPPAGSSASSTSSTPHELPQYRLAKLEGVELGRGSTASEVLRLAENRNFKLAITPKKRVSSPSDLELVAYLVAPGDPPRRWPIDKYIEAAETGAFKISGTLTTELVPKPEEHTLLLIVGRRQAMPDPDQLTSFLATRTLHPPDWQHPPGWQEFEVNLEILEP